MSLRGLRAAAVCAGLSLVLLASHGAPVQAGDGFQQSGSLPDGAVYILRRDPGVPTAAVEFWFRAPAAGYDNRYPGIARLAIAAAAASHGAHGTSFAEFVNRIGGALNIQIYPDIVMLGARIPSARAQAAFAGLADALFHTPISDEGLKAAQRDAAIDAAEVQYDSERSLQDRLFAALFVAGPAHYPPTPPSPSAFAKIPAKDIRAFAARTFRQSNAFIALAGNLDVSVLSTVANARVGGQMATPYDSTVASASKQTVQSGQAPAVGLAWAGPPIAQERDATALDFIADYLFDPEHGVVPSQLDAADAGVLADGQFVTLHNPGVLVVTLSGKGAFKAQQGVIDAVRSMQNPMDAGAFGDARRAFMYHILQQIQTPAQRADNFGWYAAEGNAGYAPGDASGAYMRAAESLSPDFVAAVARRYLEHPMIVRVITAPPQNAQPT